MERTIISDLADAVARARIDAEPTIAGALERCGLCGALAPVEWLRFLPCTDFVIVEIVMGDHGVALCRCHMPSDLPVEGEAWIEIPFGYGWIACPPCQTDFDAGRLDPGRRRTGAPRGRQRHQPALPGPGRRAAVAAGVTARHPTAHSPLCDL
jgi:hypothetical protein